MKACCKKFDKKSIGKTSDFIPGSISDCAVASMVWSTVYAYDASKLKTAPSTVNDFFDLQKFPGKRGLRKSPKVSMEWALIADGVDPKDVYKVLGTPAGVDRAFKKLDTIKKNIVWWESGAQAPQLLADGAVVMVQAYNGRIDDAAKKDNKPFKAVWDAQVYDFEWWAHSDGREARRYGREVHRVAGAAEGIGGSVEVHRLCAAAQGCGCARRQAASRRHADRAG